MGRTSKKETVVAADLSEDETRILLKSLAEHIRKTRKSLGFRTDHFAYEIGISRQTLIRMEKGEDMLTSNLVKVIYGLGLNMDQFFKDFPPIQPTKPSRPQS